MAGYCLNTACWHEKKKHQERTHGGAVEMAFSMPRTKMRSAYLFEDLLEIRTEPVPNRVKTQMHLSLASAEARLTGAQILKSKFGSDSKMRL